MPLKISFLLLAGLAVFSAPVVFAANQPLPSPEVSVSSTSLSQGGTLLVVVKNAAADISGSLGLVKLRFFRSSNQDWVALVGMPLNKIPGIYKLTVKVPGQPVIIKDISVKARVFPVTVLQITQDLKDKGYSAKSIASNIQTTENASINEVLDIITPQSYVSKPFANPLAAMKVVGDYGDIRKSGNVKIQHLGVDLKAAVNTPVYAANDGKVVFTKSLPDYGNTLVLDHGLGVYSLYLHLDRFNANPGQMVKQGDIVGFSGQTGYVLGPHLHFSIKVRGSSVDPLQFINAAALPW